jgi:hypothetical protein
MNVPVAIEILKSHQTVHKLMRVAISDELGDAGQQDILNPRERPSDLPTKPNLATRVEVGVRPFAKDMLHCLQGFRVRMYQSMRAKLRQHAIV